jgi:hypothetical protein
MIECLAEANATLRKADVGPHLFLRVINTLFASPVYANYGRIIADQQFEPARLGCGSDSKTCGCHWRQQK